MKLQASVPDSVTVQLKVGSGDASVDGARSARIDTGSGDVRATRVRGELAASLGSGDLEASDIGSLDLGSVGSGDAALRNVRGARSEEHTSELQSLLRTAYAAFRL